MNLYDQIFSDYGDKYFKNIKVPTLITVNKDKDIFEKGKTVFKNISKDTQVLKYLKLLEKHDEYTKDHSISVSILSFFLAYNRGYDIDQLTIITKGALLHDIGKTQIPLEVLNKPGRLTPEEFQIIQTHSKHGYELVKDTDLHEDIKDIILYHHARRDGSGYPKVDEDRPLKESTEIVSLCDVFDALTGDRVYKPGMPKIVAYRLIHSEMHDKLNVELLDCLIDNLCIFELGEIATLNTSEKCEVIALNASELNRPIVRILEGENKGKVINLKLDRNFNLIYT